MSVIRDEQLTAVTTFPEYSRTELAVKQMQDSTIAAVLKWCETGHKPTERQLRKETPAARKLLRKWEKLVIEDTVLWYKVDSRYKTTSLACTSAVTLIMQKYLNRSTVLSKYYAYNFTCYRRDMQK